MRKHLKKAVSFMMAVCLLAGNSYVDTRANTSVTMTEWVEEVPESSDAGTEVAETEKVSETASAEETKAAPVNTVFSYLDNSFKTLGMEELINPKVRIASAEDTGGNGSTTESNQEIDYKYVFIATTSTGETVGVGETLELNRQELTLRLIRVSASNPSLDLGIFEGTTVTWNSDNEEVLSITNVNDQVHQAKFWREGPGYVLIAATVWDPEVRRDFQVTCYVKAGMKIEKDNKWREFPDGTGNYVLVLEQDETYEVELQYQEGRKLDNTEVSWRGNNQDGVVTVGTSNEDVGKITAVGAGACTVTIYTNTVDERGNPDELTFEVIVRPAGKASAGDTWRDKVTYEHDPITLKTDEFTLYSNGQPASANMNWEVYQILYKGNEELPLTKKNEIKPEDTSDEALMYYTISDTSGNIDFKNVKAGTYRIIGYSDKERYGDVSWNKVVYDVVVNLDLQSKPVYLGINDIYDVTANSNIPTGYFQEYFSNLHTDPLNANYVDALEDGTITGKTRTPDNKEVIVQVAYRKPPLNEKGSIYAENNKNYNTNIEYTITVIDGLSLNSTILNLYTGETFQLLATVTDRSQPIVWESTDPSRVKVDTNGLVTAVAPTEQDKPVEVSASQMVDGVKRKIVCKVFVQPAVTEITLDPAEIKLEIEEYATIKANVKPTDISNVSLKWISSDPEVVKVSEESDLTVVVQALKGGSAVITAINAENVVVGHCKVIVNQPAEELILSAGGKVLSDGEEVRVPWSDRTFQLYAEILPEETTNKEVTWKSSNPKIATVDEHGLVTFNKSGKAEKVTIIVQSQDNPNLVKTCTINILASVNGVELDQHELNLFVGESERLTYLVNPDDVANKTVTWTSFDTSIAAVDKTGMVTAKGPGKTQIMIMTEDGSFYDLCTVTVDLYATSVKMNYKKVTMNRGDYFDMEVTVAPANSTVKSLIWESLNPSVVTVSSNGRLTARNVGTAIVMVKTQTGSLAYCEVTVLEPMVSLELDETDITIDVDEKFLLTPEFSPEEPSNTEVKWSTSDEDIAEVNLLGEVTGISGGTVVITCETVDGGYRAFCLVTVEEPVYELTVTPDNYRLGIGKTYQLTATMTNKGTATDSEIIWSSSDESICTVDKFGKITGVNFGYATIKAEAADGYGAYATCEVRVVREVTSIRLNYYRIQLVQGETVSLRAEIQPSNATYNTAQFVSDDLTVAVVDEDGLITGITPGTTWVHANAKDNSGVSAACFVEVIAPIPATGVTVSDKEIVLVPGESKEVIASIRPANSTDDLTWSSGNEFIATVDSNGKITARMVGTTDVTVMTTSGKTATVKVIVLGLSRSTLEMPVYTQYSRLVVDGANAP
ncbi:MAG: Ig domain-containing protein, partial [Lachnospiraceae bacterium]|nr:Ig domain-containing protein [Lachnospiraceae bacterium]